MATTTDEEAGLLDVDDDDDAAARSKPKPRPRRKAAAPSGTDTEHDTMDEGQNPFLESPMRPLQSPSKTQTHTPRKHVLTSSEGSPSLSEPPTTPEPEPALFVTPKQQSRKRPRTPDEDEEMEEAGGTQNGVVGGEGSAQGDGDGEGDAAEPGASQETTVANEIKIRRKRVRH